VSAGTKRTVTMCRLINQGLWKGLGSEGGTFWLHKESLTFKGPAALQATAVYSVQVNKIPPNFNTLFVTSLYT
jgi:hypothetical protein